MRARAALQRQNKTGRSVQTPLEDGAQPVALQLVGQRIGHQVIVFRIHVDRK